jgi:hypothetical protein
MSVTETDLEMLESYLDDELPSLENDALRRRLSSEPDLTVAMDDLRRQRELRQQFFASLEPDEQSVERVIKAVRKSVTREIVFARRARALRNVGSLAACLIVGFVGGYGLRGGRALQQQQNQPSASIQLNAPAPREVVFQQPSQSPLAEPNFSLTPPGAGTIATGNEFTGYQVRLVDETGHVIGVKRFKTLDDARRFQSDWQNQQTQTKDSLALPK